MRQATGLRGNLICIHQAMQRRKNRGNCRHRVRRRIHANDGVSATVEQSLEHRQKDASDVICWVIGLEANTQHFAFSHRVAAAGNVANPGGGEDEILVAHQFGYCGRDLRDDGPLNLLDLNVRGCVVQEEFAKLADRHAPYHTESFLVEGFQDEACDIVLRWIDQGTSDNLPSVKSASLRLAATRSRSDRAAIPANWSPDFSSLALANSSRRSEKSKRSIMRHFRTGTPCYRKKSRAACCRLSKSWLSKSLVTVSAGQTDGSGGDFLPRKNDGRLRFVRESSAQPRSWK